MHRIIDSGTDQGKLHCAVNISSQKVGHINCRILFIQPACVKIGRYNNRHSVMDRRYFFAGSGGYNGAGINSFLLVFPMLPKPCKSEQGKLRLMNMIGLFSGFNGLPFKKSGRRNQAAPMLESIPE